MTNEDNTVRTFLGKRKFNKLTRKILAKRFVLRELDRRGKRIEEIASNLTKGDFEVDEETTYIAPGVRKGKITISIPQKKFSVSSFYHIGYSKKRKAEIEKDFEVSNFLSSRGVKAPEIAYKKRSFLSSTGFGATECMIGDVLSKRVTNGIQQKKLDTISETVISQIFKYHKQRDIPKKAIEHLEQKTADDFYSLDKFVERVGKKVQIRSERIDEFLAEREGILHNDLHTGNIIANGGEVGIIDWGDATLGPIHIDVCRYLISKGFYEKVREEERRLRRKGENAEEVLERYLDQEIGEHLESNGYDQKDFYSKLNLADALIKLRIAGVNYDKFLKKMEEDRTFENRLESEEKQLIRDITSYRFTLAVEALEKEGLTDLTRDLENLVADIPIERRSREWVDEFILRQRPDVRSWEKMRTIGDKLLHLEDEKKRQDTINTSVARKRIFGNALTGLASIAAVLALGFLGHENYVKPIQNSLEEKQRIANYLADNWEPDLAERMFVSFHNIEMLDGKPFLTQHPTLVPNFMNYVPMAEDSKEFRRLFEEFKKNNPDLEPHRDFKACISDPERYLTICFPATYHDDIINHPVTKQIEKECIVNNKLKKGCRERILEAGRSIRARLRESGSLSEQSLLEEIVSPYDYYQGLPWCAVTEHLERVYFGINSVLESMWHTKPELFSEVLSNAALRYDYKGDDNNFKLHLLSHHFMGLLKENQDLASSYVSLFCPQDAIVIAGGDKQKIFLGEHDYKTDKMKQCVQEARDAYFSFLVMNGIDQETVYIIRQFDSKDQNKEILYAKSELSDRLGEIDQDPVALRKMVYEIVDSVGMFQGFYDTFLRSAGHLLKTDCSDVNDLKFISNCFFAYEDNVKEYSEILGFLLKTWRGELRGHEMKKLSEDMKYSFRKNFPSAYNSRIESAGAHDIVFLTAELDKQKLISPRKEMFRAFFKNFDGDYIPDEEFNRPTDRVRYCLDQMDRIYSQCRDKEMVYQDGYEYFSGVKDALNRALVDVGEGEDATTFIDPFEMAKAEQLLDNFMYSVANGSDSDRKNLLARILKITSGQNLLRSVVDPTEHSDEELLEMIRKSEEDNPIDDQ